MRSLLGYAGATSPWQFCFQSCSANNTCSECSSPPLLLLLNSTSGTPSSLCGATHAIQTGPRMEDSANLGRILFALASVPELHSAWIASGLLSVVCLIAVALAVRRSLYSPLLPAAGPPFPDGSMARVWACDWAPALDERATHEFHAHGHRSANLRVVRSVAALLILLRARGGAEGAGAAFPLYFALAGFDQFVSHAGGEVSAIGLASRLLARLWPAVFVSSVLGMVVTAIAGGELYGEYLLLPMQV